MIELTFASFETKINPKDTHQHKNLTLSSDSQDSKITSFGQVFYTGASLILEVKISVSSFNHHIK